MRPLRSRLQRYSPQYGAGSPRQGLPGRDSIRQQSAHGIILLRLLRGVYGVLPDRGLDQPNRSQDRPGSWRALPPRRAATSARVQERLWDFPAAQPESAGEAALQGWGDYLSRGRLWFNRFLYSGRQS